MSQAITTFKKYVAADVLPCPDPIVEREILSVIIDFCDKTHILTREFNVELDSDDIDEDYQNAIDIPLGEWLTTSRPVTVLEFNLDGTTYIPKYRELQNTIPDDVWESLHDDNTIYFSFPSTSTIRIYDRETTDENLYIRMSVKPTRAATTVDDCLLEDWVDTIAAGVKYKIMSMPGKEWTDPAGAAMYYVEYKRGVSRARMKVLKAFSGTPLEVTPRLFGQVDWE
jgi:hypothetical protein